jgi:hypothetical protein
MFVNHGNILSTGKLEERVLPQHKYGCWSSGLLHHIVFWLHINILQEHSPPIFRAEVKRDGNGRIIQG